MTKNRLEAFSDGVFAIAITLLVIELHTPEVGEGGSLAAALWAQWPSYVAYLVSFLTIGVIWLNHHRVFTQVAQVDGPLLVLNLVVLLWTALIPFPTAVVARYLGQGGEHAETAVAFYSGVFVLLGLSFGALFVWITRDDRLLHRLPPPEVVRAARLRFTLGEAVYLLALGLSFVWPPAALALHAAMALYYAFDQASVPATPAPGQGRPSRRPALTGNRGRAGRVQSGDRSSNPGGRMRARPWQLAVVVAACGAAVLVAGRATGSGAGGGPDRTVVVTMHHSRFQPATVRVEAGQRVRFVLRNTDPIDHEFILGDAATQRRHERGRDRHHHGEVPGERSVPAGQEAATSYTFPAGAAGQVLEFACHLPGHYAYGMRGTVRVSGG